MRLQNTIAEIASVEWKDDHEKQMDIKDTVEWYLGSLKTFLFSRTAYGGYNRTPFVGNLYQMYKQMYRAYNHTHDIDNIHSSEPLPSGNLGTIKIEKV